MECKDPTNCEHCAKAREKCKDRFNYLLDVSTSESVVDAVLEELKKKERRGWVRAARRRERGKR